MTVYFNHQTASPKGKQKVVKKRKWKQVWRTKKNKPKRHLWPAAAAPPAAAHSLVESFRAYCDGLCCDAVQPTLHSPVPERRRVHNIKLSGWSLLQQFTVRNTRIQLPRTFTAQRFKHCFASLYCCFMFTLLFIWVCCMSCLCFQGNLWG